MIVETTVALILTLGARPSTKEPSWVKSGPYLARPYRADTEGQIMPSGEAAMQTEGLYIQNFDAAVSRLDWLESEIKDYGQLERGWDGPGSEPPSSQHLDAAVKLIKLLPGGVALPKPMLSSSGALGLYWDEPSLMADIAIESDSEFSFFLRSRGDSPKELFFDKLGIEASSSGILKEAFQAV